MMFACWTTAYILLFHSFPHRCYFVGGQRLAVFLAEGEQKRFQTVASYNGFPSGNVSYVMPEKSVHVTQIVCAQLKNGAVAMFGPATFPGDVIAANYANHLTIPHFYLSPRERTVADVDERSIDLFPGTKVISGMLTPVVIYYKWSSLVLLYQKASDLTKLQHFIAMSYFPHPYHVIVRQLPEKKEKYGALLDNIKNNLDQLNIVIHSELSVLRPFLLEAAQRGMCTPQHQYIVTHFDALTLNLLEGQLSDCNVTAFSLVRRRSPETLLLLSSLGREHLMLSGGSLDLETAVRSDALLMLRRALQGMQIRTGNVSCNSHSQFGNRLINRITRKQLYGTTGPVAVDSSGKRVNYSVIVLHRNSKGFEKLGEWNSATEELALLKPSEKESANEDTLENKTLRVAVYVEQPFVVMKENVSENTVANERYTGYCIELLEKIAEVLKFKYILHEVKDKTYGSKMSNGKWNGLVGELMRGEADIAVASLTISYSRSEVIDFTVPYMHLGISILYKKPAALEPNYFAFMEPLSADVWYSTFAAYIVTSVSLWLLGMLTPYERVAITGKDSIIVPKQFNLPNSFWFIISSLMQQGSELSPRAISTRIIALTWWFFTLVLISSYTANLAAFLTTQRMVSPIESADDLSKQTKIKYGTLGHGSTMTFFKESKIDTYEKMWKAMSNQPSSFVNSSKDGILRVKNSEYAYLMESSMLEYAVQRDCSLIQIGGLIDQKGYGIGLPKGSPLREPISKTILQLQEKTILTELKEKWWKKGAVQCDKLKSSTHDLEAYSLYGIFIFLLIGLISSTFCALLEFCIKVVREAHETKEDIWVIMKRRLCRKLGCSSEKQSSTAVEHLNLGMGTVAESHYENKMASR